MSIGKTINNCKLKELWEVAFFSPTSREEKKAGMTKRWQFQKSVGLKLFWIHFDKLSLKCFTFIHVLIRKRKTTLNTQWAYLSAVAAHIAFTRTINIYWIEDRTCTCKAAMPPLYTCSSKGDPPQHHSELQILLPLVKLRKFIHLVLKLEVAVAVPNTGQCGDYANIPDQLDDIFWNAQVATTTKRIITINGQNK